MKMSRATPDQVIAHVELLRAVDRLLVQAETVREKREALDRLLPDSDADQSQRQEETAR
jgi:hypothetical protein